MTESSARGLKTGKDKRSKTEPAEFRKNHALIIGIDKYSNGISPLATAVNDARRLAQILEEQYSYSITLLVEEVTRSRLRTLFQEELSEQIDADDRLLVYFAGHGVALDGKNGPEGYLIPQDATLEEGSFWPMTELHKALDDLPCRHMLAILDCCFAGAFRWSSTRDLQPLPPVIYKERYERFLRDPAWQVITSAAYNQKALDTLSGYVVGMHGVAQEEENPHSPFALSLFEALHGAADCTPKDGDGIITATELYLYLRDQVEVNAEQLIDHRQTPSLWPLNKHRQGEFIFLLPDYELNLPPAPDLTEENNPYKGLSSYEKGDSKLFFGRTDLIKKLQKQVEKQLFTVVLGASGTGKSSLVKAGLLPALENPPDPSGKEDASVQVASWFIPEKFLRPGTNPADALRSLLITELPGVRPERREGASTAGLIGQWQKKHSGQKLLLVIDQFEEIITLCREEEERENFIHELMEALEEHRKVLRVVLTLRSDFEAQISQNYLKEWWQEDKRFVVPPMTQDELREVIEQPASVMVLYFEPRELVDRLINEVIQTPGALPLLSFTLSELYRRYIERQKDVEQQDGNRALTEVDYEAIGGVIGSLRRRIDNEYEKLPDAAHKEAMKRIMLRMVAFEGGELTRRRVPIWEFEYPDAAENERVQMILDRLLQVRLIVGGKSETSKGETESYVEPAHDALIVAWDKLLKWQAEEAEAMLLQRQLTRAAADWEGSSGRKEEKGLLWDSNPKLLRTQEILREKGSGEATGAKRGGLFQRLQLFWRVLFPSYKDFDQYLWLNQVETGFVRRSIERKRNWTWTVTGILVAVVVVLTFAWWNAQQQKNRALQQEKIAIEQKEVAEQERDKAEKKRLEANYNLAKVFEEKALGALERAEEEYSVETYQQAVLFTAAALDLEITQDKSALKPKSVSALFFPDVFNATLAEQWRSPEQPSGIINVAFSPDGRRLASVSYLKGTVILWDVAGGKEPTELKRYEGGVTGVAFSPDGKMLALASKAKTVQLWNLENNEDSTELGTHDYSEILSVSFSPDGKMLASASYDGIRLWNIVSGKETAVFVNKRKVISAFGVPFSATVRSVSFSPDGRKLASASSDRTVRLWDIESGQETAVFQRENNNTGDTSSGLASVTFSPDGKMLASAFSDDDNTVRLWDIASGKEIAALKGHKQYINDLSFSPDGKKLASASRDRTVRIWDVKNGKETAVFQHNADVTGVSFSPDGGRLASASRDRKVRIWGIEHDREAVVLKGHEGKVSSVAFSPDGTRLASASEDTTIRLWDIENRRETAVLKGHKGKVFSVAFNPDGTRLASASEDRTVRLWDAAGGKETAVFKGHKDAVLRVSFSPDREMLASTSMDRTIRLWDIEKGEGQEPAVITYKNPVSSLSFSPASQMLTSASHRAMTVQLWNVADGKEAAMLKGHKDIVTNVAFSPDGTQLASASEDRTVRLWDITDGKETAVFKDSKNGSIYNVHPVTKVAFSPEGKMLASASYRTVRLRDVADGRQIMVLKGHEDYVTGVAFSPDGTRLATASDDKTVRLWDVRLYYNLFLRDAKPTSLYRTFIEGVKFLWQLDIKKDGVEIVETDRRTPADLKKYGTLLVPPPLGQTKFDQVLEWAQQQEKEKNK